MMNALKRSGTALC